MENGLKSAKAVGPYSVGQSLPVFSHATFIPFCFYFFFPNAQIERAVRDLYTSVHSCKRVPCNARWTCLR